MRKDFYIEIYELIFGDGRKGYKAQVGRKKKWWFDDLYGLNLNYSSEPRLRDTDYSFPFKSLEDAIEAAEKAIAYHLEEKNRKTLVQVRKVYP